jgi:hypothetical protein
VQEYLGILDTFVRQQGEKAGEQTKVGAQEVSANVSNSPSRVNILKLKKGTYAHAERLTNTIESLHLEDVRCIDKVGNQAPEETGAFHVAYEEGPTTSATALSLVAPEAQVDGEDDGEDDDPVPLMLHGICQSGFGTGPAALEILPQRHLSFAVAELMAEVTIAVLLIDCTS